MAQLLTCAAQGNEHYTGEMTYVAFQHMKHNISGEYTYAEYEMFSILYRTNCKLLWIKVCAKWIHLIMHYLNSNLNKHSKHASSEAIYNAFKIYLLSYVCWLGVEPKTLASLVKFIYQLS